MSKKCGFAHYTASNIILRTGANRLRRRPWSLWIAVPPPFPARSRASHLCFHTASSRMHPVVLSVLAPSIDGSEPCVLSSARSLHIANPPFRFKHPTRQRTLRKFPFMSGFPKVRQPKASCTWRGTWMRWVRGNLMFSLSRVSVRWHSKESSMFP